MQEDGVFKVPKVRKRRVSLYCQETLEDLDKIWNSPTKLNTTAQRIQKDVRKSLSFDAKGSNMSAPYTVTRQKNANDDDKCIYQYLDELTKAPKSKESEIILNDAHNHRSLKIGTKDWNPCTPLTLTRQKINLLPNPDDQDEWVDQSQDEYTMALLNEFTLSHSLASPHLCKDTKPDTEIKCCDPERLTSIRKSNYSADSEDPMMCPDILIVKDENMSNADSDSSGSDVDWDSLTPPVPRSPSDHTVPNMDAFELDMMATFEISSMSNSNYGLPNGSGNTPMLVTSHQFSQLSFDHVVPDLYLYD